MRVQWRWRWWWWALAVAVWAAGRVRVSSERRTRALFPGAKAHAVAHLAADWATHAGGTGGWALEADRANYTSWRYEVRYECGARCEGRAQVQAHDDHPAGAAPRHGHGHAAAHHIAVTRRECFHLPLLLWPTFCDEMESVLVVRAQTGGAVAEVEARARCGLVAAAAGQCARALLERTERHIAAIRQGLAATRL
ncbi:hypothetical protein K1T71_006905 [Dendrolimus kikuchii]|uniref:Uncharacterized protein n=1 Tax=Dendrolimus kikuchii TaxID=765133 RepID=A0ACC1CYV5_9NEOP|nr:hypothetical protein K1T71_006905 [Dendrolimus kikuchii]